MNVDKVKLYALADTLLIRLIAGDEKIMPAGKIVWKAPWGSSVELGSEIEVNAIGDSPQCILHVAGDMWLYACVSDKDSGTMVVLDVSKPKPFNASKLPRSLITDAKLAKAFFGQCVAAVFARQGRNRWKKLELTAA